MSHPVKITRLSGFDRNKSAEFSESKITLGTDAGSSMRFDATWDKTVSPQHGELVLENGTWWYVDQSKEGTLLDGREIKRTKLSPGAVLELGKGGPKVKVEWTPQPPPLKPTVPKPATAPVPPPPAAPAPAPAPAPARAPVTPPPVPRAKSAPKAPAKSGGGGSSSAVWVIPVVALMLIVAAGAAWFFLGRGGDEEKLAAVARDKASAMGLVVAVVPGTDGPQGVATAWAVAPTLYATNSHVVESVDAVLGLGGSAFIVINREGETRLRITGTRMHPRYGQPLTGFEGRQPAVPAYDVGILIVEGTAPAVFEIADRRTLEGVDSGYRVAYLGFPMEGMAGGGVDPRNPVATMQSGIVTSATDFWLAEAGYDKRHLIQHNLGAAGGASGSPVFNSDGEVVAILSAGNVAGVMESIDGSLARVPSGVLVNFAQRIDLLAEIWSDYPAD